MSYEATVYKVIISSPGDVRPEREAIREALYKWNVVHSEKRRIVLLPVGWESHSWPEMGGEPQAILNRQLAGCDLLVAVFWMRLGTPTGKFQSGSVEEIERHIESGKHALLYFSRRAIDQDDFDSDQYEALKRFKESCKNRSLFNEYDGPTDFSDKFYQHLELTLNDPQFEPPPSKENVTIQGTTRRRSPDLSSDALWMLEEAAGSHGMIQCIPDSNCGGGTAVEVGGANLTRGEDERVLARWLAALDELSHRGFVEDREGKRILYKVTHQGYQSRYSED